MISTQNKIKRDGNVFSFSFRTSTIFFFFDLCLFCVVSWRHLTFILVNINFKKIKYKVKIEQHCFFYFVVYV